MRLGHEVGAATPRLRRISWLMLLVCVGCSMMTPPVTPRQPSQAGQAGASPTQSPPAEGGNTTDVPSDRLMAYESWRRFAADGKYRLAGAQDFRFSEKTMSGAGIDLQRWVGLPLVNGDFDEDGSARDAAMIVVDTTRHDPERFGLIIFNNMGDATSQPVWVYRGRDLSKAMLGWSRDGLSLRQYGYDASFTLCHVKLDKRRNEYICK